MKRYITLLFSFITTTMLLTSFSSSRNCDLTIRVQNIQQLKGTISIIIFKSNEGWPNEYKKAVFIKGSLLLLMKLPKKLKTFLSANTLQPFCMILMIIKSQTNQCLESHKNHSAFLITQNYFWCARLRRCLIFSKVSEARNYHQNDGNLVPTDFS